MKSKYFSPAEEVNFFEHATEREMVEYLKGKTVFVGTERWILENCSNNVLVELFKQQPLTTQNEEQLVRTREEKDIISYILRHSFSPSALKLMVELGKSNAIQQYESIYGKIKEGE